MARRVFLAQLELALHDRQHVRGHLEVVPQPALRLGFHLGGQELADGFDGASERKSRRDERDGVDDFVGPLKAEKAVDRRTEQGQKRNDPQMVEDGH